MSDRITSESARNKTYFEDQTHASRVFYEP